MYQIEMWQGGKWVVLGGRYATRPEAEQAVLRFQDACTGRLVKNGTLAPLRQFRIVRV